MRTLLVVAFAFVALPASAESLSGVCGRLVGSQTTDCLAAGNGRFIHPEAVYECGRLVGSQVVSCVHAIAGKDYSNDEAKTCGRLVGGQVTDCFARTGRPHATPHDPPLDSPAPPTNAQIRAEIAAAIEQLRANDSAGAEVRLRNLLHALR